MVLLQFITGISIKGGGNQGASSDASNDLNQENNRFFMPGITGRFTEQIQKRKLLWQKKEAGEEKPIVEVPQTSQPVATGCKQWQNTTFAQDSDGEYQTGNLDLGSIDKLWARVGKFLMDLILHAQEKWQTNSKG